MKAVKRARYYFSFRSPYSWIATRLLAARLSPGELDGIEFVPYWEPDPPTLAALRELGGDVLYRPMSREKHLYILQDVKRITSSLNLKHVWPIDRNPSWELPVLAYLAAEQCGRSEPFRAAVYRARWEEGANVHSPDVLERLAVECDIEPRLVRGAAGMPLLRQKAVNLLLQAWQEDVFGVPFFRLGHDKFWGVDRVLAFVAALRGQPFLFAPFDQPSRGNGDTAALPPEVVEVIGSLDTDTVGGCG